MKNQNQPSLNWVQKTLAAVVLLMISFTSFAQMPGGGQGGPGNGGTCPPRPPHGGPGGGPHPWIECNAHFLHFRDSVVNGVQFINAPGSGAATFAWDFGDGSSSTSSNPSHVYADTGLYTVCLIVTDTIGGGCSDTACAPVHVFTPAPRCNAHFGVRPDSVANSVRFFGGLGRGRASASTATYSWDFGDGSSSTDANPVHAYSATGVYNVCLTVSNTTAGGSCTSTWCDSVNTNFPPHPGHHHPRMAGINSDGTSDPNVSVYPNPMSDNTTIHIENTSGNVTLKIFGLNGQSAVTKQLGNGDFTIGKDNLTSGVYFYTVEDNGSTVASGRLGVN
jgi:PKD repeat protein